MACDQGTRQQSGVTAEVALNIVLTATFQGETVNFQSSIIIASRGDLIIEVNVEGNGADPFPADLLTAITTVLGLIPLAIGLNIDFFSLFSNFDPKIYIGGDNVIFWGPLAWTVIFGLLVATFLTLIIVPVLFNIVYRMKTKIRGRKRKKNRKSAEKQKKLETAA